MRPRKNRVDPFGELFAAPDKGLFLGNRGDLHDADGRLGRRRCTTRAWICCSLDLRSFGPVKFDQPGHYYPLFFLDEATALSAGHRPCALCRRLDWLRFKSAWRLAMSMPQDRDLKADDIDCALHAERQPGARRHLRAASLFGDLPDGAFFSEDEGVDRAMLKLGQGGLLWSPSGYASRRPFDEAHLVRTITPPSMLKVLSAGYRPVLHPSAENVRT
ncbi:hypothetical protein [Rhizobium alvei]|uniref:Uncharacterized protein n=1 Tax=Rhizobium alvei TaxID=1132659 RepID=A0ABT8YJL2_9HYPH|nr:hypothetical protein [Rhizobium alvei]MDO6963870.1 hypothetical protein [Rhizobium alvei]